MRVLNILRGRRVVNMMPLSELVSRSLWGGIRQKVEEHILPKLA